MGDPQEFIFSDLPHPGSQIIRGLAQAPRVRRDGFGWVKRWESLRGRLLAIRYSQREATRLKMKEHVLWLFGPTRLVRRASAVRAINTTLYYRVDLYVDMWVAEAREPRTGMRS